MSVLTDPAAYGLLNSELMNCQRTAAVLGELAAQWQQLMEILQRIEQEAVLSQNMTNAIHGVMRQEDGCDCRTENDYTRRVGRATRHSDDLHVRSPHGWGTSIRSMKLVND